jgi:hypothetical protein
MVAHYSDSHLGPCIWLLKSAIIKNYKHLATMSMQKRFMHVYITSLKC